MPVATPMEIAVSMKKRYSSLKVASEMAFFHMMDYPENSPQYIHWRTVYRILESMKER